MNGHPKSTKTVPKPVSYAVGFGLIALLNVAGAVLVHKLWNAIVIWNTVTLVEAWLMFLAVIAFVIGIVLWRRTR